MKITGAKMLDISTGVEDEPGKKVLKNEKIYWKG